MMGVRCLIAGGALWGLALIHGGERPTVAQWRGAALLGGLFFVGCHGVLAIAQRHVPSGVAALLLTTIPLWVPIINWLGRLGPPPRARMVGALAAAFAGVALLLGSARGLGVDRLGLWPVAALLFSAFCLALGSALTRSVATPRSQVPAS